jgi:8-amino-7-oxononanoate synthase
LLSAYLVGDQEYFAAHAGIDYQYNSQYGLLSNLYFLATQEAIKMGKKRINFGITSYDFKLMIGAELQPLIYFVKHIAQPRFTPALADLLRTSIKQPENIHRPFKDQDISKRIQLKDARAELDASRDKKSDDVFNKVRSYVRIDTLRLIGLYSFFPPFESAQEAVIQFNGKPVVMLGTNSYLGLSTHPELRAAAKSAIDKYGTGCSGSPSLNGTLDIHIDLAQALASFMQKEDAILFSTGYQTNLGIISAIAGRNDIVITDKLNHASLIDGARLSRGLSGSEIISYKYNDMESLEEALQRFPGKAKFVVVDSIFSMEGTMANIPTIVELVKQYGARLMLDEAHAIGVIGPGGRGVAEYFGLLDQVDLIMGTFSKSFAAVGGFVAGDTKIIDYLRHVSRPHIFSASLPPPVVATVRKALDIIIQEPERRKKALGNARFMAKGLLELGYNARFLETAIVPVHCGNEILTLALYKKLLEEGVFVNPAIYPAVPKGQERLRTSYMATHNEEMLTYALSIFAKVRTPTFPKNIRSVSKETSFLGENGFLAN